MPASVPRTIWMLWFQGRDSASGLVKTCFESWEKLNPGWRVVVLDEDTMGEYVDLSAATGPSRKAIQRAALSDVVRVNLLAEQGGVWADATCLCMRPLDEWLDAYAASGFFAFDRPGPDRLISSWFLASTPDCPLTKAYRDAVNAYWRSAPLAGSVHEVAKGKLGPKRAALAKRVDRIAQKNSLLPRIWFRKPVQRLLQAYPYYWFHYLFAEVIARDRTARDIWAKTPKVSADGPHRIQQHGLFAPPSPEVREAIDERRDPVYKLTWKFDADKFVPGGTLDYLLRAVGEPGAPG